MNTILIMRRILMKKQIIILAVYLFAHHTNTQAFGPQLAQLASLVNFNRSTSPKTNPDESEKPAYRNLWVTYGDELYTMIRGTFTSFSPSDDYLTDEELYDTTQPTPEYKQVDQSVEPLKHENKTKKEPKREHQEIWFGRKPIILEARHDCCD